MPRTTFDDELRPEQIPCCPFCDNAIEAEEWAVLVEAHGVKCLAHGVCAHPDNADGEPPT